MANLPQINAGTARGLKPDTHQIRIESILGGQSDSSHFAGQNQFLASVGIDPGLPLSDTSADILTTSSSGLLRPVPNEQIGGTTLNNHPLWMIPNPKTSTTYVYDAQGSIYASGGSNFSSITGISDKGVMGTSTGNGAEYYDNYIYFATNFDVARYGPLDGAPSLNPSYWQGTLSKTALTSSNYPFGPSAGLDVRYPNHIMHRHSDGKLYFGDIVGNQGTIHYISTTKTTVEGDTDNGSKYSALTFGYGLWPTAIESYGSNLVIALFESASAIVRAKIAFWDTTSSSFNSIVWVEFPDPFVSAIKNINGVLYVFSSPTGFSGIRVSRYIGGSTFKEEAFIEHGKAVFPGAVDGASDRLIFGSGGSSNVLGAGVTGGIYSIGLQNSALGTGLFNIGCPSVRGGRVYSLLLNKFSDLYYPDLNIGWGTDGGASGYGIDFRNQNTPTYGTQTLYWQSQIYKIGQPFKITKIRIPLGEAVSAGVIVTPKIYTDNGSTTTTLTVINNTNYPGKKTIVIRPQNLTGEQNLVLGFEWTGTTLCTIGLPITIEYELLDIDP